MSLVLNNRAQFFNFTNNTNLFQSLESLSTTFPDLVHTTKSPWTKMLKYCIVFDIVGGGTVLIQLHDAFLNTSYHISL